MIKRLHLEKLQVSASAILIFLSSTVVSLGANPCTDNGEAYGWQDAACKDNIQTSVGETDDCLLIDCEGTCRFYVGVNVQAACVRSLGPNSPYPYCCSNNADDVLIYDGTCLYDEDHGFECLGCEYDPLIPPVSEYIYECFT